MQSTLSKMNLIVIFGTIALVCGTPAPYRDPMINEGLFEGDITGRDPDTDRSAVLKDSQRWPGGIVPYVISAELEDIKELNLKAMKYLEAYTCIRFVERSAERDFIKIKKDNGCWSLWGRGEGGEQPLSLGFGCDFFGTIVHELIHALGFEHEHNRPDRDDHIIIHWEHIAENQKHNFEKLRPEETRLLTQFDKSSIMLYGSHAFTTYYKNLTMTYKDGRKIEDVHNRQSMSVLDAEKINILYNCPKKKERINAL